MSDPATLLRVVLIEDSLMLSRLIDDMLSDLDGVELVGTAVNEAEALKLLAELRPQLAIIDLELAAGTGFNVLREVSRALAGYGDPHLVVFSNHAHAAVRARCASLGARAFFDKSFQLDELLAYIADRTRDLVAG